MTSNNGRDDWDPPRESDRPTCKPAKLSSASFTKKSPKGLTRMPKPGDRLLLGDIPVVCLEIGCNGNFAQSVFVRDAQGRVSEVTKEKLSLAENCMACHGTGQDDPPPGKYHGICQTCKGKGKA